MELEEIKRLRKQIREIILKKQDIDEFSKKNDISSLKKDCYDKLVDLKTVLETEEIDVDKTLEAIEIIVPAINKLKTFLNKELKG